MAVLLVSVRSSHHLQPFCQYFSQCCNLLPVQIHNRLSHRGDAPVLLIASLMFCSILFKFPSEPWQCDSEPACTVPAPWPETTITHHLTFLFCHFCLIFSLWLYMFSALKARAVIHLLRVITQLTWHCWYNVMQDQGSSVLAFSGILQPFSQSATKFLLLWAPVWLASIFHILKSSLYIR